MDIRRFPFVRFLGFFLLGLLVGMFKVVTSLSCVVIVLVVLLLFYAVFWGWIALYGRFRDSGMVIGALGLSAIMLMGVIRFLQVDRQLEDRAHIRYHVGEVEGYEGVVEEVRVYGERVQLFLSILGIRKKEVWMRGVGKVIVWVERESFALPSYGDRLRIKGGVKEIEVTHNPYAFDYSILSMRRGIYHNAFVKGDAITLCGCDSVWSLMRLAYRMREWMARSLGDVIEDGVARAIMLALVLGIRDEMDKEVREVFADGGVLHVLAVSGLHVGMLYFILLFLLSLLGVVGYRWRLLQGVVVVTVLCSYAFITGLSASVVRAVLMLCLDSLARLSGRRYDFWNGLCVTALVGLLYNPLWLLDVGFQFSYLAVVGIGFFYRRLVRMCMFEHWFLRYIWEMVVVSLSVQLATLPFLVYYFHTFPLYFLLGNFVVVPLASLLLGLGLLCCVLGKVGWLGWIVGCVVSWIGRILYGYLSCVVLLPYAQLGPFWPTRVEVALGYGFIVLGVIFLYWKRFRHLLLMATCAVVLSGIGVSSYYQRHGQKALIVYAIRGRKAMVLVEGRSAVLFGDGLLALDDKAYKRAIAPSLAAMGVGQVLFIPLESGCYKVGTFLRYRLQRGLRVILWGSQRVVCLDEQMLLPPRNFGRCSADLLVIEGYALPYLAPWLRCLTPKRVVLGYGISRKKRALLKEELTKAGIAYHDILLEGAFVGK